jgi:IS605 OrfB family transposase
MVGVASGGVRAIVPSFVVPGPSAVSVRDRLKGLDGRDEAVLRAVCSHLGSLAGRDLAARCTGGLAHDNEAWAVRKRELTDVSSSRWAGSITKATHDQWALARRGQYAHLEGLASGIRMLEYRLSLPLDQKGTKHAPGGYRSRQEWFAKSRRLADLRSRHAAMLARWEAGQVSVCRGGKRLARARHHLDQAELTEQRWRELWEAARWFCSADGESGKRWGNETIRVTDTGQISIRLPAPLADLANAPHCRYVLSGTVGFAHRGEEWADRVTINRAVAYSIHFEPERGRWYLTASWQRPAVTAVPLTAALAGGCIGVDANDDHLAAWRLDTCGNPVGEPHRFFYDLSGTAGHRDAQVRHALTRLLHWAKQTRVAAIAIEDLDFEREKTREKHGRRKRFRRLISRFPTAKLRARLVSMAAEAGISIVAVDPAYTTRWGAQHWQQPMAAPRRKTSRHDAASIAIGRRALGHRIRRRVAPPPHHQRDGAGHRTTQARSGTPRHEGNRPPATDRAPRGPAPGWTRKRRPSTPTTVRGAPVQSTFTAQER